VRREAAFIARIIKGFRFASPLLLCSEVLLFVDALARFLEELLAYYLLKLRLIEAFCGDVFVLFHAVDEQAFKSLQEEIAGVFHRIARRCLPQIRIGYSVLANRVKKQLVCGLEIRSEAFVENIDQLRKSDLLSVSNICSQFCGSGHLATLSGLQIE